MATKKCPQCSSQRTKKNGRFRNKQGYRCNDCGKQFVNKSRKIVLQKALWKRYVWERQTIPQLAKQYHRSGQWIRQQPDKAPVTKAYVEPQPVVIVVDMMFSKKTFGVCVFRAPHLKKNLCWEVSSKEMAEIYYECRMRVEEQGFEIIAAVIDGKRCSYSDVSFPPKCHYDSVPDQQAEISGWSGIEGDCANDHEQYRRATSRTSRFLVQAVGIVLKREEFQSRNEAVALHT